MEGTGDLVLPGAGAGAMEGNRETVEGETQKWMWSLEVRKQTLAANDWRETLRGGAAVGEKRSKKRKKGESDPTGVWAYTTLRNISLFRQRN